MGIHLRSTPRQNAGVGASTGLGRAGSCFDNAAAESFWAVLKEEIGTRFWPGRAAARTAIFDFIKTFSNRRRLRKHIHWGYITPHETRLRYRQDQALAA
ncbi:IS3 family transposase [Streptomyces lavendulae]|uniref:IS3 family transposase n=1 Tax=Streptomyces lavendulae TaxID=1914 RepID=UPI0033DEA318